MSWKEFFQPNRLKLAIFLVCAICAILLAYLVNQLSSPYPISPLNLVLVAAVAIFLFFDLPLILVQLSNSLTIFLDYLSQIIFVIPIIIVLSLIVLYCYFISCLLAWIYSYRKTMKARIILLLVILLPIITSELIIILESTTKPPFVNTSFNLNQSYDNFIQNCKNLCDKYKSFMSNINAAKFCYTKLTGNVDFNRNGKVDPVLSNDRQYYACEDEYYCFSAYTCSTPQTKLDANSCKQDLCNAYYQVYGNNNIANFRISSIFINDVGSCMLPGGSPNWYDLYFGHNPCNVSPSSFVPPYNGAVLSCLQTTNTTVKCLWNCSNAVSIQNPGIIANDLTFESINITQPSGSHSFSNLVLGETYFFTVNCDYPSGKFFASYGITTIPITPITNQ